MAIPLTDFLRKRMEKNGMTPPPAQPTQTQQPMYDQFKQSASKQQAYTAPQAYSQPQQQPYSSPASNPNTAKALNELEYLKKQWDIGTKGLKTWASTQAGQYYDQLDPQLAEMVRGMNAQQLGEYRASLNQPVTQQQPNSTGQLGNAIIGGINQSPASYQDSVGTIRDTINEQANNNTPSNNLMDLFKEAINTAGDPTSEYWDPFRMLAEEQAKGTLESKQQQLDAARAGVDDKFFQEYLKSRQDMANRGLGNSGFANDSDFRLQLAKQGQMADVYSKLGTFDKESITADKFKELFDQGNKTMMEKAQQLQGMYGQASQYDKISTQDLLKQLFSYDQLKTQDNWNDVESLLGLRDQDIKQDQFAQQSKQFYDQLSQQQQTEMAKIGFDYDKLNEEKRQFYDKLSQDGKVEAAKLDMDMRRFGLDVAKVMGVDAQGRPTLDMQKLQADVALQKASLSEQFRHNRVQESLSASGQSIDRARLQESMRQNDLQAQKYVTELQMAGRKDQAGMLYDQVNSYSDQIKRLSDLVSNKDVPAADKEKYRAELKDYSKKYDSTLNAMGVISDGYK